jgi:hypothetical protein
MNPSSLPLTSSDFHSLQTTSRAFSKHQPNPIQPKTITMQFTAIIASLFVASAIAAPSTSAAQTNVDLQHVKAVLGSQDSCDLKCKFRTRPSSSLHRERRSVYEMSC